MVHDSRKSRRGGSGRAGSDGATGTTAGPGPDRIAADRLLLAMMDETHRLQTAGGPREMSLREALLRKQYETAMKGSPVAQRDLLDRDARASAAAAARIAEDCAYWSAVRDRQAARHAQAKAAGRPTADILPHPDDIEIIPGRGVRFLGPFDAEERRLWDNCLALREALFLQDALEHALNGRKETPVAAGTPLFWATFLNDRLPPSLRMTQVQAVATMSRHLCRSKRDLLRDTHRAWLRARVPLRRGTRFTSPGLIWEGFEILFTGVRDIAAAKSAAEEDAIAEDVLADLRDCKRKARAMAEEGRGETG